MGSPFLKRLNRVGASVESVTSTVSDAPSLDLDELPLQEHDTELDEHIAVLDHASSAHDRLSSLATTLENMAQTNGMSDSEAALFNHAVDGICTATPIDAVVPSMESFAHASDRLRNANAALEDVNDKLSAAAQWIKTVLGALAKALIIGIIRTVSAINSFGRRLDSIEWPKLWNDSEYIYLPNEIFITFGISPKNATFEAIERIMRQHAEYASFFRATLVPALVDLSERAIDEFKQNHPVNGSARSSEEYDNAVLAAKSKFSDVLKTFFGTASQGEIKDEDDYYHKIREGLVLPGGFRWTTDHRGRYEFENFDRTNSHLERIRWAGHSGATTKIKVPERSTAEELLSLAYRANAEIAKGVESLENVMREMERIADQSPAAFGRSANEIQFREFVVEFSHAYRGIITGHEQYSRKVTSGLIKFFHSKTEDSEHA